MKEKKNSEEITSKDESFQLSFYFYLNELLDKYELSSVNSFMRIFGFFNNHHLLQIPALFFKPIDESTNSGKTKSLFHSLDDNSIEDWEWAADFRRYFALDIDGPRKIQDFIQSQQFDKIKEFRVEETKTYCKIIETFKILNLSLNFAKFFHVSFILDYTNKLSDFLHFLKSDYDDSFNSYCQFCGTSKYEVLKLVNSESMFVKFGIVIKDRNYDIERIFMTLNFRSFLLDENQNKFGIRLIKEETSQPQPLESFFLPENEKNRIKALLQNKKSAKILLYGTPGTGKTEFAKSLAYNLGVGLLKFNPHEAEDHQERRAALVMGELLTRGSDKILLMDESDDLLNEGGFAEYFFFASQPVSEKEIWMNEFLDSMQGKVIFITSSSSDIHASVLRRFDYSMEFFPANQKQRLYYWNRVLELENMNEALSDFRVKEISETYPIGVGGITTAIRSTKKILENVHTEFGPILVDVLSKHLNLLGHKVSKPLLSRTPYDRSILHTDSDLNGLEQLIKDFKNQMLDPANTNLGSLCLLFYGKPGTGKTEYANYLAKMLEIEMIQKRSSDLLSKWVGETEKKIARAFQEAESKKGIFFLDEADSFFRNRELAMNSWEGSQTNEFLTWMETFRGIFIASTNFMKDFDPAALRRFAWKGEFKPLRRDDKIKILLQYFPSLIDSFSSLDFEDIKDISGLTTGDFRALWNKFRFRDPNSITVLEVIDALRIEASFKSENQIKSIGQYIL